MKRAKPESMGISQSKHGLLNVWLTKRNSAVSIDCNQAMIYRSPAERRANKAD